MASKKSELSGEGGILRQMELIVSMLDSLYKTSGLSNRRIDSIISWGNESLSETSDVLDALNKEVEELKRKVRKLEGLE